MAPGSDKKSNIALEVLRRTPIDKLDETVEALKKDRPAAEVHGAIIELFAAAPFSDPSLTDDFRDWFDIK